jgi:uncharacterized membrane protein
MVSGPLQYLAIGFDGDRLSGEIIAELRTLKEQGIARVVDLVLIRRDTEGTVTKQEVSDLSLEEAKAYGTFAGDLLGLFTEEDVDELAADVPPGSAAAIALLEYMWATKLRDAIRRAHGVVFSEGLVPTATIESLAAELNTTAAQAH